MVNGPSPTPRSDLNATNEYGVPLHACNGYRQDEHYWKWLEHKRTVGVAAGDPFYLWLESLRSKNEP